LNWTYFQNLQPCVMLLLMLLLLTIAVAGLIITCPSLESFEAWLHRRPRGFWSTLLQSADAAAEGWQVWHALVCVLARHESGDAAIGCCSRWVDITDHPTYCSKMMAISRFIGQLMGSSPWQTLSSALADQQVAATAAPCPAPITGSLQRAVGASEVRHAAEAAVASLSSSSDEYQHQQAIASLYSAAQQLLEAGAFDTAARALTQGAKTLSRKLQHPQQAPAAAAWHTVSDLHVAAADMHEAGSGGFQALQCLLSAAEVLAHHTQSYTAAAALFQRLFESWCRPSVQAAAGSAVLWRLESAAHGLSAVLCAAAGSDAVAAARLCEQCEALNDRFQQLKEGQLAAAVVQACNTFDAAELQRALLQYHNRGGVLQQWHVAVIDAIQVRLHEGLLT
jgi:Soluble NSF attachment protein, SNAP